MTQFELLTKNPLFNDISADEIRHLYQCLSLTKVSYKKGAFIFLQNQVVRHLGIISKGKAQIIQEDYLGNRTIIRQLEENSLFGEAFVCAQGQILTVSVQAQSDCEVLFLNLDSILLTCTQNCPFHHQLIRNLVKILAQKNILLLNHLEITTKRSLQEKILAYLNRLAQEQHSHEVSSPLGRIDLADYLGVDRSSLTRELNKLQKKGLISFHHNTFKLLTPFDKTI